MEENCSETQTGMPAADAISVDCTSPTTPEPSTEKECCQPMSKKQQKRLRKKENWLAKLPAKRAKERMRMKERRAAARENNISLGPSRKQLKNAKMSTSECKLKLVLDFSFDDLMDPKDIAKCINQTQRCYCCNRRMPNPVQFHIVNLNGKSRAEISKVIGYENWDVNIHSETYSQLFPKENLVYLTSESDNVIESLSEDKIYIIGAFVDHNLHKGLCYKKAKDEGIQHGRLPIGEFLNMKSRKVLTINHVFEIIAQVANKKSWEEAMLAVMPQRKGAVAKDDRSGSDNDDNDGDA